MTPPSLRSPARSFAITPSASGRSSASSRFACASRAERGSSLVSTRRRQRRERREEPAPAPRQAARAPLPGVRGRFPGLLQLLIFVSGIAALIYQSVWVRQLSLILGSTSYAVGTVLAAFMAGLGTGAFVIGRGADRVRRPLALYAG